ncbi:MAG: SocA family protein [Clostridia bacterium]|nr:SocA family protein [Clostridia bacterium]
MAKLKDVADFFIALAQDMAELEMGDAMTNLRLQKMLYFAQGWMLKRTGKPLFDENIEAWQYGPVVPECYEWYKGCGSNPLKAEMPARDKFSPEEYALLLDVWAELSKYSTSQLVSMTHEKGTPWYEVWNYTKQREIDREAIKSFFINSELPGSKEKLAAIPTIKPLFRENGIPVFSAKEVFNNE